MVNIPGTSATLVLVAMVYDSCGSGQAKLYSLVYLDHSVGGKGLKSYVGPPSQETTHETLKWESVGFSLPSTSVAEQRRNL